MKSKRAQQIVASLAFFGGAWSSVQVLIIEGTLVAMPCLWNLLTGTLLAYAIIYLIFTKRIQSPTFTELFVKVRAFKCLHSSSPKIIFYYLLRSCLGVVCKPIHRRAPSQAFKNYGIIDLFASSLIWEFIMFIVSLCIKIWNSDILRFLLVLLSLCLGFLINNVGRFINIPSNSQTLCQVFHMTVVLLH